ncbi:hypothetical protein [Pedobacter sp.]|uniref:hypothetical protein n=1 Tax=Pedobacter sp. TaxID=1411316 RepID=UPI003BA95D6F
MATKKVLFIGIGFYDYEESIIQEFKKLNFDVDYFCEVPPDSLAFRFYNRFKMQNQLERIIKRFNDRIVKESGTQYSLIFVIKSEYLSEKTLRAIKEKNPTAKSILYLWDSIVRISNIESKFKYFDKVFSFDRIDCLKNDVLNFNPLFYRDEYHGSIDGKNTINDLYHLGWYHSDRLKLIMNIESFCEEHQLSYKLILFTGYFSFLLHKIFGGELKNNKKFLIFKAISAKENRQNVLDSIATLDIAHNLQSGLTIRSIELLGMGRKMITTNADIVNYDFYNSSNILLIDRNNPKLELSFFSTPYEPVPPLIKERYNITNWLERMVNS